MINETNFKPELIESLMIRLLHHHEVFLEVLLLIQPNHFLLPAEQHYSLLWQAMVATYQTHGRMEYHALRDRIQILASGMPFILPQQINYLIREDSTPGLLMLAWYTPSHSLQVQETREIARSFLRERAIWRPMANSLSGRQASQAERLTTTLEQAIEMNNRISRIDLHPVSSAWPDVFKKDLVVPTTTGLQWMDDWMDGGDAPGEVNGLLGPMGVGKTTIAVNMAVAKAKVEERRHYETGQPRRTVYFVTYEQPETELQKRLWCCAGRVYSSSFDFNDTSRLTTAALANWNSYEHDMHRKEFGAACTDVPMPGEADRLRAVYPLLKEGIRVIDVSGMTPTSLPGSGFVNEISALIEADQRRIGSPGVAQVIVDYVGIAVERHMAERKAREEHLRHFIKRFVEQIRTSVAGKYLCTVWLLHQLNKDGNEGSPTKTTKHTQASEGSAFAAYLTFCASFGQKDEASSCTLLRFTKRRRSGGEMPSQILHIVGKMCVVEDGNRDFVIDEAQGRILPRATASQIRGGVDTPSPGSVDAILAPRVTSNAALF